MMYFVSVNWIGQFLKAIIYSFLCLLMFAILISCLTEPKVHDRWLGIFTGLIGTPLFFYLAVGAALNGCRVFKAIFGARYRWRKQ